MNDLTATLGGLTLVEFTIPLLVTPLENAVDVTTLGFDQYTDFVNQKRQWELNWKVLTETQYNDLKAVYDLQWTTGDYPAFVFPYYSVNSLTRMYLNTADIRKAGCEIHDIQVRLVEREAIGDVS